MRPGAPSIAPVFNRSTARGVHHHGPFDLRKPTIDRADPFGFGGYPRSGTSARRTEAPTTTRGVIKSKEDFAVLRKFFLPGPSHPAWDDARLPMLPGPHVDVGKGVPRCLRAAGEGGGYILFTGKGPGAPTPSENIRRYVEGGVRERVSGPRGRGLAVPVDAARPVPLPSRRAIVLSARFRRACVRTGWKTAACRKARRPLARRLETAAGGVTPRPDHPRGIAMKRALLLAAFAAQMGIAAETPEAAPETLDYGTVSGRVQSLTMYRDFEGTGNGFNSTLGLVLNYTSPPLAGFDAGLGFHYVWEFYKVNRSGLLANDDLMVLNEAWLRYRVADHTSVTAGRRISNGEVFRADDFRQKARSVEGVALETTAIPDLALTVGHALRMSNWIDSGDRWDFNDFDAVFGTADDSDGVTWAEAVYAGVESLEVALFDAYAYDVANLAGLRARVDVSEDTGLVVYYRHEDDVGAAAPLSADAYGAAVQQKVGGVTLEPGWFAVSGDNLRFQETTTGINHPLGSLMIIYAQPFAGGSDTFYLKATAKAGKTVLYALYDYTRHDKVAFDAQELNVVVKQPLTDHLGVALKAAAGYRDMDEGDDTLATDTRLFVTWVF